MFQEKLKSKRNGQIKEIKIIIGKVSDITTKFKEVLVKRLCRSKKDLIKSEIKIFKQFKTEISKI